MTRRKPVTTKDKMQNSSPLGVTEVQTVTPEYRMGDICCYNAGEQACLLVEAIAAISFRWEATPEG